MRDKMQTRRRDQLRQLVGLAGLGAWPWRAAWAQGDTAAADAADHAMWPRIVASVFDGRAITLADPAQLQLLAPARAVDAAFVPVTVRSASTGLGRRSGAGHIKRLTLVVDNNPAPVAAVFDFGPRAGSADIETRLRVDAYSMVRAVAELGDGSLVMSARFVKAAGGCSAPPGADAAAAEASLGRMQLRAETAAAGQLVQAQWQVSHPNHSGLAMDQLTRHYTPAHFVRSLEISFNGERVLHAELDFALSENPSLRFQFLPSRAGVLRADAEDTQGRRFSTTLAVAPA